VLVVMRSMSLFDLAVEVAADGLDSIFEDPGLDVGEDDVKTRHRRNMSDSGAHLPGSDNSNGTYVHCWCFPLQADS
jgi:hypothetical protein